MALSREEFTDITLQMLFPELKLDGNQKKFVDLLKAGKIARLTATKKGSETKEFKKLIGLLLSMHQKGLIPRIPEIYIKKSWIQWMSDGLKYWWKRIFS